MVKTLLNQQIKDLEDRQRHSEIKIGIFSEEIKQSVDIDQKTYDIIELHCNDCEYKFTLNFSV